MIKTKKIEKKKAIFKSLEARVNSKTYEKLNKLFDVQEYCLLTYYGINVIIDDTLNIPNDQIWLIEEIEYE